MNDEKPTCVAESPSSEDAGEVMAKTVIEDLRARLNGALIGKANVIEHVIACLFARGHLLFDDLPGLGKTTLAKALAGAVGGRLSRVQCTPDLLPSDVSGFNVFSQKTREFEFRAGPVFSDILLADEINRATPRTQSALFEAMAERQVTIDSTTYPLSESFFVIATQNPIESHGAFPLPEAQLDRFAMKLQIGYPSAEDERRMLATHSRSDSQQSATAEPVLCQQQLTTIQRQVEQLHVADELRGYLVDLAGVTRKHPRITLGLSPRGLLTWQRVAQATAFLAERDFVTPDDIQKVAEPILSVRIAMDHGATEEVVDEIVKSVPVPNQ